MKKVRQFKFLREGLKSQYDRHQWKIGKWYKTECRELCHGFNCSKRIINALSYVKGEILAEVEVRGKKFVGDDKSTHAEMRVIKAWKWQKQDSVALAVFAAELVIDIYEKKYPNDGRPRKAIEAAKNWLKNPAHAAYAAYAADAADAAHAAYAAAHAAYAAAHATYAAYAADAAADAADAAYAAYAATYAAYAADAADAATLNKTEEWLLSHIDNLEQIT